MVLADSVQIEAVIACEVRHAFCGTLAASRRLALTQDESVFADALAGIAGLVGDIPSTPGVLRAFDGRMEYLGCDPGEERCE